MEFTYIFEWDLKKARENIRKHGVSFERAATVFRDSKALSIYDEDHGGAEERWITIGIDQTGTVAIVCHTFAENNDQKIHLRIFSARKATKNEILKYRSKLL